MNRTFTYLIFAFLITFFFAIGNILNPRQGWDTLGEEALGFILLLVGSLLFGQLVKQIIHRIQAKYQWNNEPLKHILANLGVITVLSGITTILVVLIMTLCFQLVGTPDFVKNTQKPPPRHEKFAPPLGKRPPPRRRPEGHRLQQGPPPIFGFKPFDDAFRFHRELFFGVFALFCFLFGFEELNQFSKRKEEEKIRKEQLENEHNLSKLNALRNQLNPHFMFNNLNTLAGLMHDDLKVADEFLKELSKTLRYVLEQNEAIIVPLKKELEFIQSYLYLQEVRFGDKINVKTTIHPEQNAYLLPPLTLELLVDNALKHNIVSKKQPLFVEIFTKDNYLFVKNNFQPKSNVPPSTGIGLKNLKERLELLELKGFEHGVKEEKFVVKVPLLKPE